MSFSCPELNLDEMLQTAKNYGYEGIEPRIGEGHKHGIEPGLNQSRLDDIKRRAEKSGVEICCLAAPCYFSNPGAAPENIELAKQVLDLARGINCRAVRVFGGAIPEGADREIAAESIVHSLASLSEYAAERGAVVCMETHDDWSDPAHVADIMMRINSPSIAVNWDIMHPVLWAGCSIEESFRALAPWIRHVHAHDGINDQGHAVFKHIGTGCVDHKAAVGLLKNMGYNGFISGEWIGWEPYEVHLPAEIAVLRSYEDQTEI